MTLAAPSDIEVREHLWESFASQLRSYATVHETFVFKISVQHDGYAILVRTGRSSMQLALHKNDGSGMLVIDPEGGRKISEPIELRLDGTIRIGESVEALDLAAIHLMGRFVKSFQDPYLLALVAML